MFDRMTEQKNFRIAHQLGRGRKETTEVPVPDNETIPQRFRRLVDAGKETKASQAKQSQLVQETVTRANTVREIPQPAEEKKLSPKELREKIVKSSGSIKEWKEKREAAERRKKRISRLKELAVKIVSLQKKFGEKYDFDAATDQLRYERELKELLAEEGLSYKQSNVSQFGDKYHYELSQNGGRVDSGKIFETYEDLFEYIFFNILREVINFPAETGQLEKSDKPITDRLKRAESRQNPGDRLRKLTKGTVRQAFYIKENKV